MAGFAAQTVVTSSDATPGLPAQHRPRTSTVDEANLARRRHLRPAMRRRPARPFSDLPYLFVVDQRQFVGGRLGTRGQILRITPRISDATRYRWIRELLRQRQLFSHPVASLAGRMLRARNWGNLTAGPV